MVAVLPGLLANQEQTGLMMEASAKYNPHSDTSLSILGIKPTPGIDILTVPKK